jgi:roadblock/LC7 domain-containing protein
MSKQTAVIKIRNWIRTNGEMSEDGKFITYSCSDLEEEIKQAKEMEKQKAHEYAQFAIMCDRNKMFTLNFEDWNKFYNVKFN